MKKLAYIIVALCINLAVHGQYKNVKVEPTDTIFKLGGAVLLVDVTKVTTTYVSFVYPGQNEVYTIERKQIEKIIYKNGRIDEFNNPIIEMIDEYQWEAVWLTEEKKEVVDLYKSGSQILSQRQESQSREKKCHHKAQEKGRQYQGHYCTCNT